MGNPQGVDEGAPEIWPEIGSGGAGALLVMEGRRDHIQHGRTVEVIQRERCEAQEGFDERFSRERLPGR